MELDFNDAIGCFQKKIGTYDKANWEISVENQTIEQISENSSTAKLPTDLLDVDLIRGSTFTKAKPCYNWTHATTSGLLKLMFYPLYHSWWRAQMVFPVWLFFLVFYFLQLLALFIYLWYQADESFADISWPEASVPILALLLIGQLYIHVISSNVTKPIGHNMKKKKKRSERSNNSKSNRNNRKEKRKARNARKHDLDHHKSDRKTRTSVKLDHSDEGVYSVESRRVNDSSPDCFSREHSVERELNYDDDNKVIKSVDLSSSDGLRKRINKSQNTDHSQDKGSQNEETNLDHSKALGYKKLNQPRDGINKTMSFINSSGGRNSTSSSTSSGGENSDSNTSDTSLSENEEQEKQWADMETQSVLFPNAEKKVNVTQSNMLAKIRKNHDLITVSIWRSSSFKKAKLTFFEIGLEVVNKVETMDSKKSEYLRFSILAAILIGILPLLFRTYQNRIVNKDTKIITAISHVCTQMVTADGMFRIFKQLFGASIPSRIVVFIAMVGRIASSFSMFFLLCVAEAAFRKRYMYAKFFSALTSTRRARRNGLPHFRLHKVKNIKAWLSLRSFLRKRGPQRSIDVIVSVAFIFGVLLLVTCCVQFLSMNDQKDHFLTYFFSWEVSVWSLVLGVFLMRFITLGSDINRKNKCQSILLTEQVNLYLQMERKAEKKEELLIANNVLKLAAKLLKEFEGPFKVSGFIMNPLLSNITRVVVLSFFSGVMSDILGFRLRLWKIKTG